MGGNAFAQNSPAGIVQAGSVAVHARGDNTGEQATPTLGTLTVVPGF